MLNKCDSHNLSKTSQTKKCNHFELEASFTYLLAHKISFFFLSFFCFNVTAIRLKTQWNKQSIYLYEASFSVMTLIKTNHWGRLHLKQFHYCSELPATKNDEAPQWSAFSLKCKFLGTLLMQLQCYLSSTAWRKQIGWHECSGRFGLFGLFV